MGAAGSVQAEVAQENIQGHVEDGSETIQSAVDRVEAIESEMEKDNIEVSNIALDRGIAEISEMVGDGSKAAVTSLMESVRNTMTTEEVVSAVEEIKSCIPSLEGDAVLVTISASLQVAADMAPAVMASVGGALVALGEHLPYIGVACAAIGAVAYAFKLSKEQDENIKTVSLWMASVKDWLLLVSSRVDKSAAASTVPLFEGLQDALLKISTHIDTRSQKWRITKMLTSTSFERDFTRAKDAVIELKTALRDYLDQESQDRQESALANISSAQIDTNEKLTSMEDQLTQIQEMLIAQAKAQQQADIPVAVPVDSTSVRSQEEEVYSNIQRAAGVGEKDVPFQHFVVVFETFFCGGADMPSEQRRGLKIAIDRENTGTVSKPQWIKFYRQWTESKVAIEQYLNQVAEANPTLCVRGKRLSNEARLKAKAALAERGIHSSADVSNRARQSVEDAKNATKAALAARGIESTDDAKKIIAAKASELSNFGRSLFTKQST